MHGWWRKDAALKHSVRGDGNHRHHAHRCHRSYLKTVAGARWTSQTPRAHQGSLTAATAHPTEPKNVDLHVRGQAKTWCACGLGTVGGGLHTSWGKPLNCAFQTRPGTPCMSHGVGERGATHSAFTMTQLTAINAATQGHRRGYLLPGNNTELTVNRQSPGQGL
jgi:hypothetical protein